MEEIDHFEGSKTLAKDILQMFIFMTIAVFAMLYGDWYESKDKATFIRFSIFLILFGITHWRFNISLAFLYNVQKKITLVSPTVKPVFLKWLGIASFVTGLIVLVYCCL